MLDIRYLQKYERQADKACCFAISPKVSISMLPLQAPGALARSQ